MEATRRAFCCGWTAALARAAGEAPVPELDGSRIRIAAFRDEELEIAQALPHFARVANSVRMQPPNRGFIDIAVWRNPKDNRPYNARIMENVLSLAWFYTARRSWNPYRGHPALRRRLEAALDFWCSIQDPQGRFSEYGEKQWNLAATAFAVKFMGEALRLLNNGPPLSRTVYERALEACRKSIHIVLTDAAFWKHGLSYSNQYTNVFAGAPAYFEVRPDADLFKRLIRRIEESSTAFQSPCGYFYEADGPDFGYNLGTHHRNVHMAWHYFRRRPEGEIFVKQQDLFCDWLGYNAWPESEGLFALNRAIETRQRHSSTGPVDTPVCERSLLARAFARDRDSVAQSRRELRARLEREWPRVAPLAVGQFWAFSPYLFLHLSQFNWHPSREEVEEARRRLPAWRPQPYLHERMDSRHPVVFHYIRRPAYVAAFASGPALRPQQRLGLTLVWTPAGRTVLQSQTSGAETAWGLFDPSRNAPVEAGGAPARYRINGAEHKPAPGVRDLGGGAFQIEYDLAGGGSKRIRFEDHGITMEVDRPGEWVENIPLLQGPDRELCRVEAAGLEMRSAWHEEPLFAGKRVRVVTLRGRGQGSYRLVPRA